MRKLALIFVLALVTACHATIAFVQSALGGTVSGSGTSPYTLTTNAVGFTSTTTAGNMLLCIAYDYEHAHTAGQFDGPIINTPVTSGITWSTATADGWTDATTTNGGRVVVFYMVNAPSIGIGITTTVTAGPQGAGAVSDLNIQFALYEFSGVKTTSPVDFVRHGGGSVSGPSAPGSIWAGAQTTIPTTASDLVIVEYQGDASSCTAGTGYTLGVDMTALGHPGQLQYQVNVGPGNVATSFVNSINNYGPSAVAFLPATGPGGAGVTRRKGWIF